MTKDQRSPRAELRAARIVFKNAQHRLNSANANYNYAHARLQRAYQAVQEQSK